MATAIILIQFAILLVLIFKGARIGGIGLGITAWWVSSSLCSVSG